MTRRLLGPIGGPIAFLIVAGLVFAGLGWVTVASLRVEEAQREAARRADREKELRLALTRMDARIAPALGVEDTRPFHEFKTFSVDDPITIYGPASGPLLAGELPEWMQLHFQLDPEAKWESPQVLDRGTLLALRRHWHDLPLRNTTKARAEQLAELNAKFPARAAGDSFASRDRTPPPVSPPSTPFTLGGGLMDDNLGLENFKESPGKEPTKPEPVNTPAPAPPPIPGAGAEAKLGEANGLQATAPPAIRKADADPKSQIAADPKPYSETDGLARDSKKRSFEQQNRMEFDDRQSLFGLALGDVARFKYQIAPSKLAAQKKNATGEKGDGADRSLSLRDLTREKESVASGPGFSVPPSEFKSDSYGFYRLMEEARTREVERKQLDNLHRGGLKQDADAKNGASKDAAKSGAMAFGRPNAPGIAGGGGGGSPASGSTMGGAGPGGAVPGAAAPGAPPRGVAPMAKGAAPPPAEPTTATPDPAPAPMLIPAEPPMVPPAAGDEAVAPPLAVHLGTLRPQWLVGTDGTPLLVLVRTARVENKKTLYQGVVLDWAKLQALLLDEVKELFPDAKLEPRKDDSAESREQSMTALPVKLDTGADAPPPPAGWTPLRIGLVLAWAAAVVAFAAIGLSGWSLVDLADRRIRFVSAVTHELRTPLTSLRLYLDLLLSGMVQDEDKRREYLSTLNVESDRLHRLIDNVLDFAKLERSRKGRDLQPVKAADLLDSIRLTWMDRVAADGKELVVESSLPADLGITTDGSLVQQIVGNLIDNARKYTRDAADVRIRLRATLEGAKLVFEVEDRGCGVAPREQKTIFRPFRRGETADTKAGGAGLGLALSKEWAEVLGGRLTYRTPEGAVGSCFRLELPAKS